MSKSLKRFIVSTTINSPTPEIRRYDSMEDWTLLVVGDKKTPEYELDNGFFMDWDEQQKRYPDLCELIGPNSVARGRMIAFIWAYQLGADIVATIDDDNYPYENWGKEIHVGRPMKVLCYETNEIAFDPLIPQRPSSPCWHRGFPIELVRKDIQVRLVEKTITPMVQANLWDGDPDIDATVRLATRPHLTLTGKTYYSSNVFSPINTQNTILHRKALRDFPANIPFIGRADDIWASYLFQARHPNSVVYGPATVMHKQSRSVSSMLNDLDNELFLYKNNMKFLELLRDHGPEHAKAMCMPPTAVAAIEMYENYFKNKI